ncbi:N-acetylmuramoyl-L-alanine amidase [Lentibacillus sp. N15]|uniref:N-acetylmuramoyl-L-alanine amidase n=1 Tax=Lentibacillus songyuanensis TaxID=3136161 RepID=UPI0031BA9D0E
MKNNIIIGIGLFVCLFLYLPTVHADSGQLYQVDSATLALRDAPDQNATVLAELKQGEKVTIFQESFGWGKTFYNGEEAWAALHQLAAVNDTQTDQVGAGQPDVNEQQAQTTTSSEINTKSDKSIENGKLYTVKAPAVRLRNAPDSKAPIITKLKQGEKVTIFQESFGWGKTFYNGNEVWVALYLLDEENETTDSVMSDTNEEADSQQKIEETKKVESVEKPKQKDDDKESEAKPGENDVEKAEKAVETKNKEEKQDLPTKDKAEKPLYGYHFVIDPGHGGKDTGAIGSKVYEKTLTLSTAKKVEDQLRDKGASVTLTRTDDIFISLEERTQISNSTDTDAFISLHYNASENQSVHGIHTFFYDGSENQELANSIQKALIKQVNLTDRGAQQADFQVLRDNMQLAVLIELGFISNSKEQKLLKTASYQEKAAKGIVAGLEDYFK